VNNVEPVVYKCLAIHDDAKQGKLKKDSNGYRSIVLGAFDIGSRDGEVYRLNKVVRDAFESSHSMQRAINNGQLYGEQGHPTMEPGMTMEGFLSRVVTIRESEHALKIAEAKLVPAKDENGKPFILTMGRVRGAGKYMEGVEADFDDPETNSAVSIRTLTKMPRYRDGYMMRDVTELVTWDKVGEQAAVHADKYHSVGMQSLGTDVVFDPNQMSRDNFEVLKVDDVVGMQSGHSDVSRVLTELGWVHLVRPKVLSTQQFEL